MGRGGGGYFRFSIEAVSNGTKLTQANFPFIEAAWSNWTLVGKVRPPFGEIIRRDIQTNEAPKTGFPATRCFCRSLRQPAGRLRDKSTRKSVVIGAGVPWHPTWWVTQVQQRLCSPSPLFSLPPSVPLSLSFSLSPYPTFSFPSTIRRPIHSTMQANTYGDTKLK